MIKYLIAGELFTLFVMQVGGKEIITSEKISTIGIVFATLFFILCWPATIFMAFFVRK